MTVEFPLVDQLVIVDVYYNKANQNLQAARMLLSQVHTNDFFG